MREPQAEPGLLTPKQVAERLAVGMRTLWRLAETEEFPKPIRFNRKLVRWKASDVQRYIDSLPNRES